VDLRDVIQDEASRESSKRGPPMRSFLDTRKLLLSSVQPYLKLNTNSPNYIQLSERARQGARYAFPVHGDGRFPDPASRSQP
jgi:hypothetical protein